MQGDERVLTVLVETVAVVHEGARSIAAAILWEWESKSNETTREIAGTSKTRTAHKNKSRHYLDKQHTDHGVSNKRK